VFEDSSFLVTDEGSLYSWGRNENGFLGRETRPLTTQASGGNGKLTFSNFTPARVRKLEKFPIKRISIKDGKFMAFFINPSLNKNLLSGLPGAKNLDLAD
jgi:Regulator of chromosome condensation (RCC1) repeat